MRRNLFTFFVFVFCLPPSFPSTFFEHAPRSKRPCEHSHTRPCPPHSWLYLFRGLSSARSSLTASASCQVMPSFFDRRASDRDLRVLLVSDVHCSLTNVHRLAELLTERAQYVDMIWLAGDVIKLTPEDRRVRRLVAHVERSPCSCLRPISEGGGVSGPKRPGQNNRKGFPASLFSFRYPRCVLAYNRHAVCRCPQNTRHPRGT